MIQVEAQLTARANVAKMIYVNSSKTTFKSSERHYPCQGWQQVDRLHSACRSLLLRCSQSSCESRTYLTVKSRMSSASTVIV
jgi:hypothetical protein